MIVFNAVLPLQFMPVEKPVETEQQVMCDFHLIRIGNLGWIAAETNIRFALDAGHAGILKNQLELIREIVKRHEFNAGHVTLSGKTFSHGDVGPKAELVHLLFVNKRKHLL